MPSHIISLAEYDGLVEGYRERNSNHHHAAQVAGISPQTAKRYWETGRPDAPDRRAKAIRDLLAEEAEIARSRMVELQARVEEQEAELEAKRRSEVKARAQRDATDTRVAEAQLLRMGRASAQGLYVTMTHLSKGAAKLSARMARELERVASEDSPMTRGELLDMMRLVSSLSSTLRSTNEATRQTMEMERLLLGEPTSHVQHHHLVDVSVDEAERRIHAGLRALERAKQKGLVVEGKVLPGPGALPPQHDSTGTE